MASVAGLKLDSQQIRDELARITESDVLSGSPQLVAFLKYVVEATLNGASERIKGYTIGVEVLRRNADFDPRIDPIVRVEASRLRRALERYYAGPGANDNIIVDLPLGGYVPTFSARQERDDANARSPSDIVRVRSRDGMPTLSIEPFEIFAVADHAAKLAELFHKRLYGAFARFDAINITAPVADSAAADPEDYRFAGVIEAPGDSGMRIHLRLIDTADKTVAWSDTFDLPIASSENPEASDNIITEVSATLLQPFGIIQSRERTRQLSTGGGDHRYRGIIEASEAFRSFDPLLHRRARAALETLTANEPNFAMGFSYLAALYFREHQYSFLGLRPDPTLLDRALALARRAIEMKPESARAYHILFGVLFARHEIAAAIAAGERAVKLNPYDMPLVSDYGGRFVIVGEVDRGMEFLSRAMKFGAGRPSWHHFYMFLASYLRDDKTGMVYYASQIAGVHPLPLIARALAARVAGDDVRAGQALATLKAIGQTWDTDIESELQKFFPNPDLVRRIAGDLETIHAAGTR